MENKTGKYLKYAIGEIFLVVIGILIALQINNWNEDRKSSQLELKILKDLSRELKTNKLELENDFTRNKLSKVKLETILNNIDKNIPYNSAMDTLFFAIPSWASPAPTYTAYEIFKIKGVEIIKNEEITKGVINLYETSFEFLVNDNDKSEWSVFETVSIPFISKHFSFSTIDNNKICVPNNYNEIKNNPEFRNIITIVLLLRTSGITRNNSTLEELKLLSELIDNEIENY